MSGTTASRSPCSGAVTGWISASSLRATLYPIRTRGTLFVSSTAVRRWPARPSGSTIWRLSYAGSTSGWGPAGPISDSVWVRRCWREVRAPGLGRIARGSTRSEILPTLRGRDVFPEPIHGYHWHSEGFDLPDGAELLAMGRVFENQAFRLNASTYGLQFHPEVTLEMMQSWMEEAAQCLAHPGAHSRARQTSDAERYHEPLGLWLEGFLDRWIEGR